MTLVALRKGAELLGVCPRGPALGAGTLICSLSPDLFWLRVLEEIRDHESLGEESLLHQD